MKLTEEIKRMRQIMSVINEEKGHVSISCPKCDHSWTIEDEDPDPYLCHTCGYDKLEGKYEPEKLAKWKKESGLEENDDEEVEDDDNDFFGIREDLADLKKELVAAGVNDNTRLHLTHDSELKRVNTPSEFRNIDDDSERLKKVLKKYPIDTWKKFTFKTIKQLYLNDIDIDINDTQAQQQAQQPQGVKDVKNYTAVTDPGELGDLISDFNAFKEGSNYDFKLMDGGIVKTNLVTNSGGSLLFDILENGLVGVLEMLLCLVKVEVSSVILHYYPISNKHQYY
jgi:ribosomal protein L37AE/L43A